MSDTQKKGFLITLEGTEGAGKTTQAEALCMHLICGGRDIVHVKEPGGTPVAEAIRKLLLSDTLSDVHVGVEMGMFLAAKIELYQRKIAPAIAAGKVVVCERGWASMFAYQGARHGVTPIQLGWIKATAESSMGMDIGPYDHLQILLDQSIEQQRARVIARGVGEDHFERRGDEFFAKVNESFKRFFVSAAPIVKEDDSVELREVLDVEGKTPGQVQGALRDLVRHFRAEYVDKEGA